MQSDDSNDTEQSDTEVDLTLPTWVDMEPSEAIENGSNEVSPSENNEEGSQEDLIEQQ